MNRLIAWFASNRVAANIFVIVVAGAGLLTVFLGTRVELLPEIKPRLVTVTVPYPGASPEEAEQAICVRVEEAIQEIQGIRKLTSHASEGVGLVMVELEKGVSVPDVLDKVKSRVDGISTFPAEAEEPVVRDVPLEWHVASIAVSGRVDEAALKRFAERVRDDLQSLPGITHVRIAGARPYEIAIEVSEDDLRRHGLTFDEVARVVRTFSLDLPGGNVKTQTGEILVRTKGQAYRAPQFEAIPLLSRADGSRLLLGEVARVRDGFADVDLSMRFNGEPSLLLMIYRVGEQSALGVADAVKKYVEDSEKKLPEGIRLTLWEDWSGILKSRLDLLVRNARTGLILVFLTLALFLRPKLAVWVTIGIPVAFLGALWLMPWLDTTINLLSLFGFILVLGIVVDDAIVVSENIYRHRQAGVPGLEASIRGAREVFVPVVMAVMTNIFAFVPMLFLPGPNGDFARPIPIVVMLCLAFSLVEAFVALPAHLSTLGTAKPGRVLGRVYAAQDAVARGFEKFVEKVYRPLLGLSIRHRYVTLAVGASGLLLTAGLVMGGRTKFDFFPPVDADNVVASITLPQGTPVEVTEAAVARLERAAKTLREQVEREQGRPIFRHAQTTVGFQPMKMVQDPNWGANQAAFAGSHVGEVNIGLISTEERGPVSAAELGRRWNELVGPIPDAQELSFITSATRSGAPIHIELRSSDLETLPRAAQRLKEKLAQYPGVFDISDSYRAGQREVQVALKPSGEALGLTLADLARQVRQAFYGEEAQRIQRGRDDVRVMVRYPEEERRSLGNLTAMRIRGPGGVEAPFSEVAEVVYASGPATIQRRDRRRAVTVTADVDRSKANSNEILDELRRAFLPGLTAEYPGLAFSLEGQRRDQEEMMAALGKGTLIVLLLVYAFLAVTFRSYLQPAIIMLAIPFGIGGAIVAHFLLGMDLTMLSMIGMMALTGVVINDAIVMIDFINEARRRGLPLREAVLHAGPVRFRPIILTSLTTFAGLIPIMLEKSLQAQFLIPMAVSLAYGVMFSTLVTLFIVPAAYLALEDAKRPFRKQAAP